MVLTNGVATHIVLIHYAKKHSNQYNIHVDIFISETLFSSGFRQKYILGVTVQQ